MSQKKISEDCRFYIDYLAILAEGAVVLNICLFKMPGLLARADLRYPCFKSHMIAKLQSHVFSGLVNAPDVVQQLDGEYR